ncbi:hypothetical protein A2303_07510 [Candidatus Falkowbacteria bacterium RIFOXYB2_FULL_47_14]|uniref:HD/PDEase domain-containing protein n=1 Tax=Candidatus Falkowbacteria bacterium RIFOXYA2_FULL_47_19 TaxID=1797994 RepID=A0A1F5SHR9_9BACT|nr:MAG: hypothetical protein A2227_01260 [Candidatus Falkowbacteria bacterium RIFOXYA2_FULL_47_19]OGF34991.1 MAG: hypothetical protein A2468_07215 [Candidatus Falkowbacteria bacterium RIFOXYC2_FULL_46_15]OGF43707.1 MAG: hypothetical protein A2303_07510 [Candidatus Falkowbacteria bacterium RIFOXYB2_FULL_47_14]
MSLDNLVKYILEMNQLLITPRTGWDFIGKGQAETAAEHLIETAVFADIIARKEKEQNVAINPDRAFAIGLFHDAPKVRTGYPNQQYFSNHKTAEEAAFNDQIRYLNNYARLKLTLYRKHFEGGDSPEGVIAKDADLLQWISRAKEFADKGYPLAHYWIEEARKKLQTETARKSAKNIISGEDDIYSPIDAHEIFLSSVLAFVLACESDRFDPEAAARYISDINRGGFRDEFIALTKDARNLQFIVRAAKKDAHLNLNERQIKYIAAQIKTEPASGLAARFMSPDIQNVAWWG